MKACCFYTSVDLPQYTGLQLDDRKTKQNNLDPLSEINPDSVQHLTA